MAKAGNTTLRVLVSILTIPFILYSAYRGGVLFLLFVTAVGVLSYYEYIRISEKKESTPALLLGGFAVLAVMMNSYYNFIEFEFLSIIIAGSLLLRELFRNKGSAIVNLGITFLGIFYVGVFASTLIKLREFYEVYEYGGYIIVSMFASIWICDSAAFFGGTAFGKRRLYERVSPKKSWEGAIFGLIGAVAAFLAAYYWYLDFLRLTDVIILGLIVGTIGQMGDLVESLIKRDAGVKDSSNLIPGHGGMFDRFDSVLMVAPAIYIYLKIFTGF